MSISGSVSLSDGGLPRQTEGVLEGLRRDQHPQGQTGLRALKPPVRLRSLEGQLLYALSAEPCIRGLPGPEVVRMYGRPLPELHRLRRRLQQPERPCRLRQDTVCSADASGDGAL